MSVHDDRAAVRAALQTGYGDAAQTVLDDQVARSIMETLQERGWFTFEQVAAIVAAAGGEVRISSRTMDDAYMGRWEVQALVTDSLDRETIIRTRETSPQDRP